MSTAWKILAALTLARLSMGFQFQSIPALTAPLISEQGLSFAAIGTLTGAYLLPGVAAALAGGWLGQKVGDSRTALWGLALMSLGGVGGWWAASFEVALVWRLLAGIGAVALNVMLSKMAADWFQERSDLPTAMGVLVSSWPAGIALAMLSLPPIAVAFGMGTALLLPAVLCAVSLLKLASVWRAPKQTASPAVARGAGAWFSKREFVLVFISGSIWGLYNLALIAAIAWTPGLLEFKGVDEVSASAAVSLIGWAAIVSVAAGGWIASRSPWPDLPALLCFGVSALLLATLPLFSAGALASWLMIVLGLAIGPAAAVIMTLPVEAARPQLRSMAMGVYFAIYYGMMGIAPSLLGFLRDGAGEATAPLYAAAIILLACLPLWMAFRVIQRAKARLVT
ncbi:MAG: MFS transporter [Limibacillus sp.]